MAKLKFPLEQQKRLPRNKRYNKRGEWIQVSFQGGGYVDYDTSRAIHAGGFRSSYPRFVEHILSDFPYDHDPTRSN